MDRISESSDPEEARDTYDGTQGCVTPELKRLSGISASIQLGKLSHGHSFLSQAPNLLQVPYHPSKGGRNTGRRHSWIPCSR